MSANDESILQEYLAESLDHLEGIEDSLLKIESDGANIDEELVNKVFRAVHTIKGGAGFLNLQKISVVCHAQENILNLVRSRQLVPTNEITSTLLVTLDTIKGLLTDISMEAEADVSSDLERLNRILSKANSGTSADTHESVEVQATSLLGMITEETMSDFQRRGFWIYQMQIDPSSPKNYGFSDITSLVSVLDKTGSILASDPVLDEVVSQSLNSPWEVVYATILEPSLLGQMLKIPSQQVAVLVSQDNRQTRDIPVASRNSIQAEVKNEAKGVEVKKSAIATDSPSTTHNAEGADKIKVSLSVVDKLMALAGELVLARNQLVQSVVSKDLESIERSSRQLNFITSELQMNIMSTRMQPVGNVFNRFRRIVRDMGQKLNKKVQLIIVGEEVELDRNIIEAIGDPLTHIVRNSMDHGIELPQVREAAGKNGNATIQITARHEAGMVVLEVSDDGAGIDTKKVLRKALEKGLVTAQAAENMSDKEILSLVFLPGFSTAEKVTDISGRGVGMDVVRTTFARLGGSVDITSVLGKGTTLQIRLPLTLAIIPALMVRAANQVFAIPQVNLQELVRIAPDQIKKRINRVGNSVFLRLRSELLPLLSVRELLKIKSMVKHPETGEMIEDKREQYWDRRKSDEEVSEEIRNQRQNRGDRRGRVSGSVKIAVVTTGNTSFGIVVDGFLDTEEVVLKPLGSHLQSCRFYAGATILGDGRPALIFDICGVAEHWLDKASVDELREKNSQKDQSTGKDTQSLIILKGGAEQYYAAPLGLITRIEEISSQKIEKVSGKLHMQYRGEILPLMTLDTVAKVEPLPEQDHYYVVLFKVQKKEVGLLVSEIVDTVETDARIDQEAYSQTGIMGTSIIDGRTTFVLDLYGIAVAKSPELAVQSRKDAVDSDELVMVVDDSVFFRTQIKKFVEEAGYKAIVADDGSTALELLQSPENQVTIVLTDIEMPIMDGLELTRQIRSDSRLKSLPVVAITSLMGSDAEAKGFAAGVDQYMIKLDREKIIDVLHRYHETRVS